MKQIIGWREAFKLASGKVGYGVAALGAGWVAMPEETQRAVLNAVGLNGVGATLAASGLAFVFARVMRFDRPLDEPVRHEPPETAKPAAKKAPARKRAPRKPAGG